MTQSSPMADLKSRRACAAGRVMRSGHLPVNELAVTAFAAHAQPLLLQDPARLQEFAPAREPEHRSAAAPGAKLLPAAALIVRHIDHLTAKLGLQTAAQVGARIDERERP